MPSIPAGVQPIDLTPRAYTLARLSDRFLGTNMAQALQSRAFGPGVPLAPTVPQIEQQQPRQFQYPVSVNTVLSPRREYPSLTPFEQLRNLAALYDVAALCIATRIEELCGLDWHIVAKDKKQQTAENPTCDALATWFAKPDQVQEFPAWLSMVLYDLFVLDAMTVYPRPSQGGGLWGLEVIDGSTIKPLLDARGQTAAYQQILYGTPWSNYERERPDADDDDFPQFSPQELIYRPRWTRSFTPYGFPPSEWIIIRVNTALRKQTFDLAHFTDGNIPAALAAPPDGLLNPEQVAQFEEWFNASLAGDDRARTRIKFLPWAAKLQTLQELSEGGRYETSLDEWMLKITCAAYGTMPAEIGFTADINKATSQGQENVNERRGLRPLAKWLKSFFDHVIQVRFGQLQLEWQWQFGEAEDKVATANMDKVYYDAGAVSGQELRSLRYPDLDGPASGPPAPAAAPGGAPAVSPFERLAKRADDRPADWEERQKRERAAQRVFAAAYLGQDSRIKVAIKTDGSIDPQVWADEPAQLVQAVLPFYDELTAQAAQAALGTLPIGVDWSLVNEAVLKLAQQRAAAFAQDATATSQAQVEQVIADWIKTGGTMDDLIARVGRVWEGPRADVAAVTEVTRVYAEGNAAAWQASDVVKAMKWRTSNDEAVCPICGPLANSEVSFGGELPPAHPNCRCWIVPIVKKPEEM